MVRRLHQKEQMVATTYTAIGIELVYYYDERMHVQNSCIPDSRFSTGEMSNGF